MDVNNGAVCCFKSIFNHYFLLSLSFFVFVFVFCFLCFDFYVFFFKKIGMKQSNHVCLKSTHNLLSSSFTSLRISLFALTITLLFDASIEFLSFRNGNLSCFSCQPLTRNSTSRSPKEHCTLPSGNAPTPSSSTRTLTQESSSYQLQIQIF